MVRKLGARKETPMKPFADLSDHRVVKALAHPLRVQILGLLEQQTASPSELAAELRVPLGNVSYHVRQLQAFGLIRLVRTTPRRGSIEHHYELVARPDITDQAWEGLPDIVKDAMVGAALAPLGRMVNDAAVAGGFSRREAHLSRTALTLDDDGWRAVSELLVGMFDKLAAIERDSVERLAESDGEASHSTVVLMNFESPPVPEGHNGAAHHEGEVSDTAAALQ
jgi:DNA-binding transcriptional ArsR family regulator